MNVALARVGRLAVDVGRLRRLVEPDGYAGFLGERIANEVEVLDAMFRPTAAELYLAGVPIADALATVDRERQELLRTLGAEESP